MWIPVFFGLSELILIVLLIKFSLWAIQAGFAYLPEKKRNDIVVVEFTDYKYSLN